MRLFYNIQESEIKINFGYVQLKNPESDSGIFLFIILHFHAVYFLTNKAKAIVAIIITANINTE